MRRVSAVALAETAATAVLWGTAFPVITLGIRSGLDPRVFVFLRFAIAAPIMLAVAVFLGRGVVSHLKMKAVWVIGFFNAVGYVCQFIGQAYTGASVAALLVNLSVVFVAMGGALFLKEGVSKTKVVGVMLAVVGTALLTTGGNLALVTQGQIFGEGLYLLAAVSWAAYIVYAKKKTDVTGWDPLAGAASIVSLTAVFVLPIALTADVAISVSIGSWEAVLYTALFTTAIPFVLYQAGLRYLTATLSAVVLLLSIVTAVAISTILLGEVLNAFSWAGAACILVSVLMVSGLELGGKSLSVGETQAGRVQVP